MSPTDDGRNINKMAKIERERGRVQKINNSEGLTEVSTSGDRGDQRSLHYKTSSLTLCVCVCLSLDRCESVIGGVIKIDKDSMTAF